MTKKEDEQQMSVDGQSFWDVIVSILHDSSGNRKGGDKVGEVRGSYKDSKGAIVSSITTIGSGDTKNNPSD